MGCVKTQQFCLSNKSSRFIGGGTRVEARAYRSGNRISEPHERVPCRHLMDATCEVLMPWAAPIGSGQGPRNPRALGRPFIGSRNIPSFARDETIGAADRVN